MGLTPLELANHQILGMSLRVIDSVSGIPSMTTRYFRGISKLVKMMIYIDSLIKFLRLERLALLSLRTVAAS